MSTLQSESIRTKAVNDSNAASTTRTARKVRETSKPIAKRKPKKTLSTVGQRRSKNTLEMGMVVRKQKD